MSTGYFKSIVLLATGLVLLVAASGCEELAQSLDSLESTAGIEEGDPVHHVPTAAEKEKAARESLEKALESKDPRDLDVAIESRPRDSSYVYTRAVLAAARADEFGAINDIGTGLGIDKSNLPEGTSDDDALRFSYERYLDTALMVQQSFPRDSEEWQRIDKYYCGSLKSYLELVDLQTRLLSLYPDDTCE